MDHKRARYNINQSIEMDAAARGRELEFVCSPSQASQFLTASEIKIKRTRENGVTHGNSLGEGKRDRANLLVPQSAEQKRSAHLEGHERLITPFGRGHISNVTPASVIGWSNDGGPPIQSILCGALGRALSRRRRSFDRGKEKENATEHKSRSEIRDIV